MRLAMSAIKPTIKKRIPQYLTYSKLAIRAMDNENEVFHKLPPYHTNGGSNNWSTIEKPNVTRISPRLIRTRRQHTPFVFGQQGLGAAIVSTITPRLFADFSETEAAGCTEE